MLYNLSSINDRCGARMSIAARSGEKRKKLSVGPGDRFTCEYRWVGDESI